MRIDYQILWMENDTDWLEPKIDDIKEYLNDLGFELKLTNIAKYEDKNFSDYDIIVVDFNLDNESGTDAIEKIIKNRKNIFTDILFYSIDGEPKLRKEMADQNIDGVYCANRRNCIEKLKKLINITVKKTQEINNLRGLVMAETGELDYIIKDILLKNNWDDQKSNKILDKIKKSHVDKQAELDKHKVKIDMSLLINSVYFFHAMFSFLCLKEVIDKVLWEVVKEYEEIIIIRNTLAHGKKISSSAEEIIVERIKSNGKPEKVPFTPDDFIKIRKKIREFRAKF